MLKKHSTKQKENSISVTVCNDNADYVVKISAIVQNFRGESCSNTNITVQHAVLMKPNLTHHMRWPTYKSSWYIFYVVSIVFYQMWEDQRLSWNVSEFENISSIYVKTDMIWVPDVVLINEYVPLLTPCSEMPTTYLPYCGSNHLQDVAFRFKETFEDPFCSNFNHSAIARAQERLGYHFPSIL